MQISWKSLIRPSQLFTNSWLKINKSRTFVQQYCGKFLDEYFSMFYVKLKSQGAEVQTKQLESSYMVFDGFGFSSEYTILKFA